MNTIISRRKRLKKSDLPHHIQKACDGVGSALDMTYNVESGEDNLATAVFKPAEGVEARVQPYAGSCDSVDIIFDNGQIFSQYAYLIQKMGKANILRIGGGDVKIGVEFFKDDLSYNCQSKEPVEIGAHVDTGGLNGALFALFYQMQNKE